MDPFGLRLSVGLSCRLYTRITSRRWGNFGTGDCLEEGRPLRKRAYSLKIVKSTDAVIGLRRWGLCVDFKPIWSNLNFMA